jgi:hypothetical protein
MAARIGILATNQDIQMEPRTYVKRSVAELLVRRLLAEWIGRRIIRMLTVVEPMKGSDVQPRRPYIPEKLPPVELPGLHFEDPRHPVRPLSASIVDLALG